MCVRDWVSRRVREHMRRSQCLPPSSRPLLIFSPLEKPQQNRGPTAAEHSPFSCSAGSPGESPLHHTRKVSYRSPLSSVGFHHQSWPDCHHWDLPTLHHYTPSVLPEQYPRRVVLKKGKHLTAALCISSVECSREITFLGQITTEFIQVNVGLI